MKNRNQIMRLARTRLRLNGFPSTSETRDRGPVEINLLLSRYRPLPSVTIHSCALLNPVAGSYVLPSSFKVKRGAGQSRDQSNGIAAALMLSASSAEAPPPPSIPTRFQSYGYEVAASEGAGGAGPGPVKLKPQQPLYPVYKGDGDDRVGPCDYDPKVDAKFHKAPVANFSKVSM